jgi:site-specific recombinase XerD
MATVTSLKGLIERYQQHQLAVGRSQGTIDRYEYTFTHFGRFLELEALPHTSECLTSQVMERFTLYLRDTPIKEQNGTTIRQESGIHAHLRDLRAFTRWLYRNGLLEREVFISMPKIPKRLIRILDDTKLQRVWQSKYLVGNSPLSVRNRAMLALMLDTGLRREEVATITLDNLSMERRTITVIGKGNKERRVFFSMKVREQLKEFLAIRGLDDEPLFHLNAGGIRTQFRRIKEELGMETFHPHLLRHQFATQMLRETKNMEYVRLLLGHEDYNTTKRYLQLTDEDLQEAHELGSPFDKMVGHDEPTPIKRRQRYSRKTA